jgi:transmembrane sensor
MVMSDDNDDLWNEAMALLLRWQAAPSDAGLRAEIVAFCAQSDAHHAAWNGAKRLYRLTGEATGAETPEEKRKKSHAITRRKVLAGVGAVVAGAAVLEGPGLWRRWHADIVSGIGQIDERRLPDGSRITLGPDSAVQIAFSPKARLVNLIEGMALFDVAEDGSRPFQARTGDLIATAGTNMSFELRQNGGRSLVGIDKGRVLVDVAGASGSVLADGDWLVTERGADGSRTGRREADQVAAWRHHLLVAEQDRIGALVAEIARWQSARVVIAQTNLAASRVSGLYDLRDPRAALEAVVEPYGGHVRQITPWLLVLSTI